MRTRALTLLALALLVAGAAGCPATVCGEDLENCRGRCAIARECREDCASGACAESCKKVYVQSCRELGVLYAYGMGVEQDQTQAVELFEIACNRKDTLGCNNLGEMYEQGRGVKADQQKALELYKTGCDDKITTACLGVERLESK